MGRDVQEVQTLGGPRLVLTFDNGERREVPSRFVLDGETVRFDVGAYDTTRELVIDPVIAYSSWFGASGEEGVLDMAIDTDGGIVLYGYSRDLQGTLLFPTTAGAAKATRGGDQDVFVTKFNSAGSAIVFSTLGFLLTAPLWLMLLSRLG